MCVYIYIYIGIKKQNHIMILFYNYFLWCSTMKKTSTLSTTGENSQTTGQSGGDRMSLLSRHLAIPTQASNFLWFFLGLPSMWEGGVANEPHLWDSWVPEAPPFSVPLKRPSTLCLEVSHWGQHLCYILAVGESTEMLEGGSILTSYSRTCWDMPVSRTSL